MLSYKQQYKETMVRKYGEPTTLEELFYMIRMTINDRNGASEDDPFVTGFNWNIVYRDRISNTHSCPINGKTNWGCKDHLPRGYPGFTGRVWIRIAEKPKGTWLSDYFDRTLSYPGTGGSGSYSGPWQQVSYIYHQIHGYHITSDIPEPLIYSWDYKIFADDFPLILDTWTKNNLFEVIKTNEPGIDIKSNLLWEDPATKELDDEFIAWATNKHDSTPFRSAVYA